MRAMHLERVLMENAIKLFSQVFPAQRFRINIKYYTSSKLKVRITAQQILVRKYLINPIFWSDKPFFFTESLCVMYMLCTKYIQEINSNAKLNTKLTDQDKRDGTRAKRCDYSINNVNKENSNINIEMTIGTYNYRFVNATKI